MDKDEKLKILNDFNPDFSEINKCVNKPNIFRILRLETMEIRHSNFLAWLLDSKANHGIKSKFLTCFLRSVLDSNIEKIRLANLCNYQNFEKLTEEDISNFLVDREHFFIDNKGSRRYIDLLLVDNTNKLLICIENKVLSLQHDNQLEAYEKFVESIVEYNDYDKLFLYLTSTNEDIKSAKWIRIQYDFVLSALERIPENDLNGDAKIYLKNYIDILRRDIMHKDEELRKKCKDIYVKYKDALDIIFEYIKNPLTEIITNNLDEAEAAGKIQQVKSGVNRKSNSEFRFTTEALNKLVPLHDTGKSEYWKTSHRILYNIIVQNKDNRPYKIHFTAMLSSLSEKYGVKICTICGGKGLKKGEVAKNGRVYSETIEVNESTDFYEVLDKKVKQFIDKDIKDFEHKLKDGGIENI